MEAGDLLVSLNTQVLQSGRLIAAAKAESTTRLQALRIESQLSRQRFEKLEALQQDGAGSIEETERAKADASVADLEVGAAGGELRLRKLELDEIDARIAQRQLRSPINGIVTEVKKEIGEYVSLQEPHVATVVQLDRLRVTFYVPTETAATLTGGGTVTLSFPDSGESCHATIHYVGVVTEADSGRVRVDVAIDNPTGRYRSGVLCQLRQGE